MSAAIATEPVPESPAAPESLTAAEPEPMVLVVPCDSEGVQYPRRVLKLCGYFAGVLANRSVAEAISVPLPAGPLWVVLGRVAELAAAKKVETPEPTNAVLRDSAMIAADFLIAPREIGLLGRAAGFVPVTDCRVAAQIDATHRHAGAQDRGPGCDLWTLAAVQGVRFGARSSGTKAISGRLYRRRNDLTPDDGEASDGEPDDGAVASGKDEEIAHVGLYSKLITRVSVTGSRLADFKLAFAKNYPAVANLLPVPGLVVAGGSVARTLVGALPTDGHD